MKRSRKRWFGVKTVYRWVAFGKSHAKGRPFTSDLTLVEERIVLIEAMNSKAAIAKAEREGKRYAKTTHFNPAGQRIRIRFLKALDAFRIFDDFASGAELYSGTELVSSKHSDHAVLVAKFGQRERKVQKFSKSPRIKFMNREFWGSMEEV